MIEDRLLAVAYELSERTGRRPREAFMRRAVSTAYYAMFHAVCRMCADQLIGGTHWRTDAWGRAYRALDHKTAKSVLRSKDAVALGTNVATFGEAFSNLQERRHQADYDPYPFRYYFEETTSLVDQAGAAIRGLYEIGADERRSLTALLLFKARP